MNKNNRLDRENPAPLYHQIAAEIRRQIQSGRLAPGEVLAPLREAAEQWGVHLHTVRHAYAALAREGLVESRRGPGGTRVRPDRHAEAPDDLDAFARNVVREARERWSVDPATLASAIQRYQPDQFDRVVTVVECSEHQCVHHAREIQATWDVDARTWTLSHDGDLPDGEIVATYFHYNDIRRRWPLRLQQVHFVSISPDPDALRIPGDAQRVIICERDTETAEAVAADVRRVIGKTRTEIVPRLVTSAQQAVAMKNEMVFVSPRLWAELSPAERAAGRVREVRYIFDSTELRAVARRLAWPERVLEVKE